MCRWLILVQSGTVEGPFTAVVVATPLELSYLTFKGLKAPQIPPRKFQTTVTTVFQGKLQPSYFNTDSFPAGAFTFPSGHLADKAEESGCAIFMSACVKFGEFMRR